MPKGKLVLGALIATTLGLTALLYLPAPYSWASIGWGVICLWLMTVCNHSNIKALMLNLAIALFVFGGYEAWLYQQNHLQAQRVDFLRDSHRNRISRDQRHPVLWWLFHVRCRY